MTRILKNHSLDKVAQLVFGGEGVDDLVDDNHAVVHVQPRHGQAGGEDSLQRNKRGYLLIGLEVVLVHRFI